MKTNKLSFLSIFLFLLIILPFNKLKAQEIFKPGYIITNASDTVNGYIQGIDNNLYRKCIFKKDLNAQIVEYLPGQIQAYRFVDNGKFFISKEIQLAEGTKVLFLEYLIKGKVSVYYMTDKTEHLFIEKENEKIIELTEIPVLDKTPEGVPFYRPNKFTGKLKYYLSDCPAIYKEIDDVKLYPKQLVKLTKGYHDKVCSTEQCVIFERKEEPVRLRFGFVAGSSYNNFWFSAKNYTDNRFGAFAGCKLEVENLVFALNGLTLNTGVNLQNFSNYTFTTDSWKMGGNGTYNIHTITMDMKTIALKIPLTVNYMFSQSKVRPYIGIGFTNTFYLSQSKDLYIYEFMLEYGKSIPLYHTGITGLAGLKFKLNNKHDLNFELTYEFAQNLRINTVDRLTNSYFSLQAAYMF